MPGGHSAGGQRIQLDGDITNITAEGVRVGAERAPGNGLSANEVEGEGGLLRDLMLHVALVLDRSGCAMGEGKIRDIEARGMSSAQLRSRTRKNDKEQE